MKKTNLLLALILFSGNFLFAQTWDILDKSMAAYNLDEGASTNQAWSVAQGGSAGSVATQQTGYVNFTKTNAGSTARWAWLRPTTPIADLVANTPYSIEVKARVNVIGIADTGTNYEANQISLRLGGKNKALRIYLKYGDGVTTGYVSSSSAGTSNAYKVNTSVWQVYQLVFHADQLKYDVYVDGVEEPVLVDITLGTTGDQNGIYFGAESAHRCNMDIEHVKMGTGDFFSKPRISSIALSHNSHASGNESTVSVTANTTLIDNGEKLLFSLVDISDSEITAPIEVTVTDNVATADIVIPANVAEGQYAVKVIANGQIGGIAVTPKTAVYEILNNPQTNTSNLTYDEIISISSTMLNANQALSVKTIPSNVSLSEVSIYSLTGNEVYRKSISGEGISINAPTVKGMYILSVRLNNNSSKEFKILVK